MAWCRLWAEAEKTCGLKAGDLKHWPRPIHSDLGRGLRQTILNNDASLAPVTEFGMIQRQYYVAGQIARGQT